MCTQVHFRKTQRYIDSRGIYGPVQMGPGPHQGGGERKSQYARKVSYSTTNSDPSCRYFSAVICSEQRKRAHPMSLDSELRAATKGGKHTRNLDRALPSAHTKTLYDSLPRPNASLLAQMRIGKCRLKSYLHAIGVDDSDLCKCGQNETVKHVLLDCRRWRAET